MIKTYIVTCPICGKVLLKGKTMKSVEVQCPKCKGYLKIEMRNRHLLVTEQDKEV